MAVIEREDIGRASAASAEAVARLGKALSAGAAPRLLEFGLVILIAVFLALAALRLFSPPPVPETPAITGAAREAPAAIRSPFALLNSEAPAEIGAAAAPAAAETTLDLELHGTWVDRGEGTATIRTPDGKQKVYAIGEEICCGATLAGVYQGQVIISRGGARESLRLPDETLAQQAAPPPAPPATTSVAAAPAARPRRLTDIVTFQPLVGPDGGLRLALHPAGDAGAFAALGLREGDVLQTINGAAAPTGLDGAQDLLSSLQGAKQVTISVDRGGSSVTIEIPLASAS